MKGGGDGMTTNAEVLAEVKGLRDLFEERTGENGLGGAVKALSEKLSYQNGFIRENQANIATLQMQMSIAQTDCIVAQKDASDALDCAQKSGLSWTKVLVAAATFGSAIGFGEVLSKLF